MGWKASEVGRDQFLILSTQGGVRADDGTPVALGYHTGHWEVGLLVREARRGARPAAAACPSPATSRTRATGAAQGTTGMFDSLAVPQRRGDRAPPARSQPAAAARRDRRRAPATRASRRCSWRSRRSASWRERSMPGGVTLPPRRGRGRRRGADARRALRARARDAEEAADLGCRACASPGRRLPVPRHCGDRPGRRGGARPDRAARGARSVWTADLARRRATHGRQPCTTMWRDGSTLADSADRRRRSRTRCCVHAAFGGSTNLLIHIPAIAHAAGLPRPTVDDWRRVNASVPRLVDALPNGPRNHPTVRVFLAGGVPEVMLHLRELGLLHGEARTVHGRTWDDVLDEWEAQRAPCPPARAPDRGGRCRPGRRHLPRPRARARRG